jgi:aerobic-type carbon monoxide dehydrogenase small subunit (CoxS/CutS family)
VSFNVNGESRSLELDTRTTLLDALREHLHLTGPKKGCDHGQCGACTVLVDGRRINACLTLAVMNEGRSVTTIEGLGKPGALHPMQAAFVKHDGFQCGYCTPGQVCSAVAVLREIDAGIPSHASNDLSAKPRATADELRERMSGNICRCGAYSNIVEAIEFGDLAQRYQQSTFGAHFVEVAVDAHTAETRVRRMLSVCACGRILNPKTARSQVTGAMTMGVGAALMEELALDRRVGFFANHDLAGYEVPVHADIPHQDVIFLDETDPMSSPMKAKGVAELGICGVAAAVANAIYNATGARARDYPITLDKLLARLPEVA